MSINADTVLETLDQHINNGPLTGLTPMMFQLWTHFFPADTRLSVFRSERDWAVFIEIICFRPAQEDSSAEIWCYSNCLAEPALLWYDLPYEFCPAAEGEYSNYPGTPYQFCIIRGGEREEFSPTPEDYADLGIVIAPDIKEQGNHVGAHILRLLCDRLNHPFFVPESKQRRMMEESWREGETPCVDQMRLLWQTHRWRHPAITGADENEERPYALPYFQALSRAIASSDTAELAQQDPATFNTDWRIWDTEERGQEAAARALRAAREAAFDQLPPEVQEQMRGLRGSVFVYTEERKASDQSGDSLDAE